MCRNHYYIQTNPHRSHTKNCDISECKKKTRSKYCSFHKRRIERNLPLDNNKYYRRFLKGEGNINWRGGTSKYKNHYQMKMVRIKLLQKKNYTCEDCGGKGNEVHHIDKTKTNHFQDNLKVLCRKCHTQYHKDVIGRHKKIIR